MEEMLYDELKINGNEAIVVPNKLLEKIIKHSFYPIIIFFVFLSCMVIKHDNTGVFRYLVIPFCILNIICFKYYIKSREDLSKKYKLKVNENNIYYYCIEESILIKIPIQKIQSVQDKSIYHDFRGRGNRGWEHVFKIKITNGKEFIESIKKKSKLVYQYIEDEDIIELEIYELYMKHEDYLRLMDYMKWHLESNN